MMMPIQLVDNPHYDNGREEETSNPNVTKIIRLFARAIRDTIVNASLRIGCSFTLYLSKASTKAIVTIESFHCNNIA